ncbi:hypothetical protein GYB29_09840 [bacterium]|nr:hypothetical protein [bacterium]
MDSAICYTLSSELIDPATVFVPGFSKGLDYTFTDEEFCWNSSSKDSVVIYFRTLALDTLIQRKDKAIINQVYEENPFDYSPGGTRKNNTAFGSLSTAGNISRGIGFGNAQDIVVNSNLNLRINGTLANEVEVLAVISDENNPIQPEGNTQQIQDFDQVYITLSKDSNTLTVGDFLMTTEPPLYFMKYYKKSRGLQINTHKDLGNWRLTNQSEIAISRGRFNRNQINGIEGNSGPYRLSGSNGEQFIIIIAGTEVVYLDGKKLTRGEDHDYVINYNTGEITFTPSILITRYSRIVVEFQYSDRNYARTVTHTGSSIENDNWKIYGHFFNEMDLKNQPFQQNFDVLDSNNQSAVELLALAGDNNAFIENVDSATSYNNDRIMYRKIDSFGTTIYVYSADPSSDSVFYQVVFTNVGFGNGDYVQVQSDANGKVFEYRGTGMGDYAPVQVLIAPKRLNMFVSGFEHKSKYARRGLELSITGYDENTRSEIDDGDNVGYGLKAYQETDKPIRDSSNWSLRSMLSYEMVSTHFEYIERYRDVEFNRDWNKTLVNPNSFSDAQAAFENILIGELGLFAKDQSFYKARVSSFIRPNYFEGYRGSAGFNDYYWKELNVWGNAEFLQSDYAQQSQQYQNTFNSYRGGAEMPVSFFVLGSSYQLEESKFSLSESDSLQNQSYSYNQFDAYFRNGSKSKLNYKLQYSQRKDQLPSNGDFNAATDGKNYSALFNYTGKGGKRLAFNTTYRTLDILDTSLSNKNRENTLQSRIEWDQSFFKNLIKTRTFYQIGTGQEQRREFQYLQVQPGNGVYIWNDYDSNGIKTLNEFEVSSELDRLRAEYIRIFVPVPGFITTNTNKISETLEINPAAVLKTKEGKPRFLARFNSLSALILENKVLPEGLSSLINPFAETTADTSLINQSQSFRTTLFFNRSSPVFASDYTFSNNESKVLLTNGFDTRNSIEHRLNARINIAKSWTIRTEFDAGNKQYISEFFSMRSFNYSFYRLKPGLQYQFKNVFRVELLGAYYLAQNQVQFGGERTENFEIGTDIKFTQAGKGILEASVNYIKVSFTGNANSTLGYELLNGLQDGNNATWNLSYQQRFAGNIQVVLRYDGRKSENAPVIHLGNLIARYLF